MRIHHACFSSASPQRIRSGLYLNRPGLLSAHICEAKSFGLINGGAEKVQERTRRPFCCTKNESDTPDLGRDERLGKANVDCK
jgi:hypothetical protein